MVLKITSRQVEEGKAHIHAQRRLLAGLQADCYPISQAADLLASLEALQVFNEERLDRLEEHFVSGRLPSGSSRAS